MYTLFIPDGEKFVHGKSCSEMPGTSKTECCEASDDHAHMAGAMQYTIAGETCLTELERGA